MRRFIAGLVTGVVLTSVTAASAAESYHIFFTGSGITCARSGVIIGCVRSDGQGYGVGITRDVVLVTHNGHSVFKRFQP